ncbi:MAG: phosphotransferase [Bacteroidota bacterium]
MITQAPPAEVIITSSLIRQLLAEQFPELAHEKIEFLDAGWDNENYRLGKQYIIRLPRRKIAVRLLENEIRWLAKIQNQIDLAVPSPIFVGQKTKQFPWPWSIIPWQTGKTANLDQPNDAESVMLANFLKKLHQIDAKNAPINKSRGVPISEKVADILARIQRLQQQSNWTYTRIEALLQTALNTPLSTKECLLHGDLHPRNIIVHKGKLVSIIDWGDITNGDPATDLVSFWMLFDNPSAIESGLKAYGANENLIQRSIGWAIFFGVILLDTGLQGHEQHAAIGAATLNRLHTFW